LEVPLVLSRQEFAQLVVCHLVLVVAWPGLLDEILFLKERMGAFQNGTGVGIEYVLTHERIEPNCRLKGDIS